MKPLRLYTYIIMKPLRFIVFTVVLRCILLANGDGELLFFKSSLKNPSLLPDWLAGNSPCNYTGMKCKNARVSNIDLCGVDLSVEFGLISASLLTVKTLESVTARGCNVTGTVFVRSQCSKVLIVLDLAGNRIYGSVTDVSALSVCSSLKTVNFSRNSLEFNSGSTPIGVSFKVIDLSFNRISRPEVVLWMLSDGCGDLVEFNVSVVAIGLIVGMILGSVTGIMFFTYKIRGVELELGF